MEVLRSGISGTASITKSTEDRSSSFRLGLIRPRALSAASRVMRSLEMSFSRSLSIHERVIHPSCANLDIERFIVPANLRPFSNDPWELSTNVTGTSAFWEATRAIPSPYTPLLERLTAKGIISKSNHLTSTNDTQRLDLGSRSGGSGTESTRGHRGASQANCPERRRQHCEIDNSCLRNREQTLDQSNTGIKSRYQQKDCCSTMSEHHVTLRHRLSSARRREAGIKFSDIPRLFRRAKRVSNASNTSWLLLRLSGHQTICPGQHGINGKEEPAIMDEEAVPFGQNVQVIDPDVRVYVYSLVTAVSAPSCR